MSKRKQKLLIVTDYFYPHWTGYAKSLYYLIQSISKYYSISILTVRYNKSLKKHERIFSSEIIREDYLFSLSRSKYSIQLLFKFLFLVIRCDVVFINSPCTNILPLSLIAKTFGKKFYIFHQGDLILPKTIFNKIIEKVFDASSYISFLLADKLSSYTKDYASYSRLLRHFMYKFSPLLLPIDPLYFKRKQQSNRLVNKKNKILFGFAGRFVEEKGFDVLFSAIPLIKKKISNAHYYFAGETNMGYEDFYKKNLSLLNNVRKEITFLGLLDDKRLKAFYEKIDFIIIPSRSDCFNLIQAEAMLCGTPSIVSNIPGLRVLVKETGFGVLFEKENPQDLAKKIIDAVGKRNAIIIKYKKVKSVLNNTANVKKIREFIEK